MHRRPSACIPRATQALAERRVAGAAPAAPVLPPAINVCGPHAAVLGNKTLSYVLMAYHRHTSQNDRDFWFKMHQRREFVTLPAVLPVSRPGF